MSTMMYLCRNHSMFAAKTLKMPISTSVWSAHHPNAGRNIQQAPTASDGYDFFVNMLVLLIITEKGNTQHPGFCLTRTYSLHQFRSNLNYFLAQVIIFSIRV